MVRYSVCLVALLVTLVLACGGDRGIPSEPSTALQIAAGPCKSDDFTTASAMYQNSALRQDALNRCKDVLQAFSKGLNAQAEAGINGILAKLWTDWQAGGRLFALPGLSFESSLISFIQATCDLDFNQVLSDAECLVPTDIDGWIVTLVSTGGTGVTPDQLFGFRLNGGNGVYISVSSRPVSTILGPCPKSWAYDCQGDVYDIDLDGIFTTYTVESCESFGERHIRCPEGGSCVFGVVATPPGLVTCSISPDLGSVRGILYHATRPAQWILHATPAYAAVGSTMDGGSPLVLSDLDLRRREVICLVTSTYNSVSEGTTCQLLDATSTVVASCPTERNDASSADCSMFPLVADDIVLTPKAFKTFGSGAYSQTLAPITLGPADPPVGGSETVTFNLSPPGQSP